MLLMTHSTFFQVLNDEISNKIRNMNNGIVLM